jgi:peptide/nickel transport system substrate-binding protein
MKLDLNIMNSVVDWKDIANLIAEAYLKAGIQVNIVLMDPAAFIDKNKHHDFDMILGSWGGVSGSDDFSQIWGSENWANGGSNYVGFGNAAIDALIDSCNFTIDPAKRIPLVRKFQKVVYDEQPYIFLNSSTRRIAIHKRWGNVNFYIERPGFALNNFKQLNAAKQ